MESTQPKPFVFVLMPFKEEFNDIYKFGIKAVCEEAGGYAERVDEQIFDETILDRIFSQINKADLIIADMTGRNPNVFYEVGYAHGLDRRVILLTQNSADIPFDLKLHPHVVYGGSISELKNQLLPRVVHYLKESEGSSSFLEVHRVLQFFISGQLIEQGATIELPPDSVRELDRRRRLDGESSEGLLLRVHFGMRNPTSTVLTARHTYGFIFPAGMHMEGERTLSFQQVVQSNSLKLVLAKSRYHEFFPLFETSDFFEMVLPGVTLRPDLRACVERG